MDRIRYAVFTDKSIRLLGKNQYTSNVESGSTRTEIKHWVKLFIGVRVKLWRAIVATRLTLTKQ
ncbi:putative ribosomal protein L23/L15e core domain superfamily [Helianthus anomalus]